MRIVLPAGSRTAKSRDPQNRSAGSSSTSTPGAEATFSKVASRSSVRKKSRAQLTLGGQGVPVLLGAAGMGLGQHDLEIGLVLGGEGDPAEPVVGHLVGHGEPEGVPVDPEGGLGVVDVYVHGAQ